MTVIHMRPDFERPGFPASEAGAPRIEIKAYVLDAYGHKISGLWINRYLPQQEFNDGYSHM